jgi:MFS transporter, AAHS family, benzoate transport protein
MRIALSTVVDDAKFGPLQACVLALCFALVMCGGYDLVVMGVALPTIVSDLKMDPRVAGVVAAFAPFGMVLGSIFLGMRADRIGRVKTITLCLVLSSVFTALTGLAREPVFFALCRFIAGLGLGGVMPCVTATLTEYAPRRLRSLLTTTAFVGFAVGGIVAAFLGQHLLASFGWQFVFFLAAIPLVMAPVIVRFMPESASILQSRGDFEGLREIARRVERSLSISSADEVYSSTHSHHARASVARLFQEGRGTSTVMLWLADLSGLFMFYALNSWLAKLMVMKGYSLDSALTFLMVVHLGGMAGSFTGGWLSDRFGLRPVMMGMLLTGVVTSVLMAQKLPVDWMLIVTFAVGITGVAAQGLMIPYCAQFYPAEIRSTGAGMAMGIGNIGGIAAPVVIGLLISYHLPVAQNFYAIAAFVVLQAVLILLVSDRVADFNAVPVR